MRIFIACFLSDCRKSIETIGLALLEQSLECRKIASEAKFVEGEIEKKIVDGRTVAPKPKTTADLPKRIRRPSQRRPR
jgi:hypothetical protein